MRASESPQGTIPSSLMIISCNCCPGIVIYNVTCNSVALLELPCPLDSMQHLESVRDHKQSKEEYLQILPELDHMEVSSRYDTIEFNVFGHYLPSTLTSLHNTANLFHRAISKSICKKPLDNAAGFSVSASRKIFLARNCVEWTQSY